MLETLRCPACGVTSGLARRVGRSPSTSHNGPVRYEMFRCQACRSEFASPMRPAPPEWYQGRDEFYGWRWEFTEAIRDVERCLPKGRARVLEIGCGEGVLLTKLAERYEVSGLDVNAVAVERANHKGLRVTAHTLERFAAEYPTARFDAVLFFHVLEHVEDPATFLAHIRGLIAPGGYVLFSVPNPGRAGVLLGVEDWDNPPHHLSRFSRRGLVTLLTRSGFSVVDTRDQPPEGTVAISSMLANGVLRGCGLSLSEWSRPTRIAVKSPLVVALLPVAAYERSRKHGVALYVVARRA